MKKQTAVNIKAGLVAGTGEFWITGTANSRAVNNTEELNAFKETGMINRQLYLQNKPKDLPQGKMYLRKIGWRVLPVMWNSEKNMRH